MLLSKPSFLTKYGKHVLSIVQKNKEWLPINLIIIISLKSSDAALLWPNWLLWLLWLLWHDVSKIVGGKCTYAYCHIVAGLFE